MQVDNIDASGKLFDALKKHYDLKSDADLARWLDIFAPSPTISRIRHGWLDVSDALIIAIHERSGWSIKKIKKLIGGNNAT